MVGAIIFFVALVIGIFLLVYYLVIVPDKRRGHYRSFKRSGSVRSSEQLIIPDRYRVRDSILTSTEWDYYDCIRSILPDKFLVLPQVNLAAVLIKDSSSRYQNELFRNIDFGIFDLKLKPLLLVEINDETHYKPERVRRDKKVADICSRAGLPLIRFWISYGLNLSYFRKRFHEYLDF